MKQDPQYEKYFRMMSRGVPAEAVKHMMVKEGVDPAVLDCDPNRPLPEAFSPYTSGPPLKEDPVYEKFFKVRETTWQFSRQVVFVGGGGDFCC